MENQNTGSTPVNNAQGLPQGGTGTSAVNQGGENQRTFTQDDVNRIVRDRLSKYSDYDELKSYRESTEASKLTEREQLEKKIAELTPYKETASKQQKILDNLLAQELEAIPEALRGLVPDNFSPLDKLDYIRRNAETFKTVAPKPNMPTEPGAKNPTNPGLYGGKYADVVEFAKNDPGGYRKWRAGGGGNEHFTL